MAKKQHHAEHVNHERWLVSYADFITLLFAFFVVLYSISDLNSKKARSVSQSVRFAMNFVGSGGTNEPGVFGGRSMDPSANRGGGAVGQLDQWIREAGTVYEFLSEELGKELEQSQDSTKKIDERGVVLAIPARWIFESGSDRPNEKAEEFLGRVIEAARKFHRDILISGVSSRAVYPDGSRFRDSIDLQLSRLASLERVVTDAMQFPSDRVEIRSQTKRSVAGGFASPAQVERSAIIELIVLR